MKSLNILHISSDFAKQKVYPNLVRSISQMGVNQSVYVPVRTREEVDGNRDWELLNVQYKYSHILNLYDKLNYFSKIRKTFSDLENSFQLKDFDVIHAHFLFSDGGLALKAKRKFGTKYIVAVRNTDLNYFFKYAIHLRKLGNEILENADSVVFISPGYMDTLKEKYLKSNLIESLETKSIFVPNGIDDFWLSNRCCKTEVTDAQIRLIYYGEYSKNKNIETIVSVTEILKSRGKDVSLTLIGEYGDNVISIQQLIKNKPWIQSFPKMSAPEIAKLLRSSSVFIMPSFRETFGLVYIEALSQGVPIIYTKKQGVDGYFVDGSIGYSVDPKNAIAMSDKIELLLAEDQVALSKRCAESVERFKWSAITDTYLSLYNNLILNENET